MSFVKNGLWTFITLGVSAIFGLLWAVFGARILEPEGFGILTVIILYPSLLFTIGNLTFGIGTVYQIGRRKYPLGNYVANAIFISVIMGIVLYVVFIATSSLFQNTLYKGIDIGYFYISFITVVFYLLVYQVLSVLQGIKQIGDYNVVNLIRSGTALLSLVLLCVVAGFGIWGGTIAFIASFVVASIAVLLYARKRIPDHWKVNFTLLKDTLKDSGKLHIGTIATFIYSQVGLMMTNYYLSAEQVGYLAVALFCAQILFIIPQAVQTVLYPETASSSIKQSEVLSSKICRHTVMWVLAIAIFFVLVSQYVVVIFMGNSYMQSVLPLICLIPGIVFSTVAQVIAALWLRKGWYWLMGLSGIVLAVIGITLQFIFIPSYGIIGSAIATSITYFIGFLFIISVHFLYIDKKVWKLLVMQNEDWIDYRNLLRAVVHV